MNEEASSIMNVVCISIGSFLLGSEFGTAVGWGIWLIAVSIT